MATRKKYPHAVTQAERDMFATALLKWQGILNLGHWRVELTPDPAGRANLADVEVSYSDRLAKVQLAKHLRAPLTQEQAESVALHELLHILLADLIHVVREDSDEKIIEASEHTIIVLLEKLLRK